MRPLLAVLAVATIALAGCADSPTGPGSSDDGRVEDSRTVAPEVRAANAARRLAEDLDEGDDGVRRMTMRANGSEMGTVLMDMELGADGARKIAITAGAVSLTVWCTSDGRAVLQMGADVYEGRDTEGCEDETTDEEGVPSLDDPLEVADLGDVNVTSATANPDGSVDAVVRDPEGQETRLRIDPQGRIVELKTAEEDGEVVATFEYGARAALAAPETTGRIPVSVYASETFEDGVLAWEALSADHEVPLDELELRVHGPDAPGEGEAPPEDDEDEWDMGDFDTGPPTGPLLATFALDEAGDQTHAGWTFTFADDGDGVLSAGDTFELRPPEGVTETDFRAAVYDTWAERYANDSPVPALGLLGVALALAGIALARRR